ncbi:MAG TPA: pyruvate kinase [Gammaproteobacteria bacterium]|nr:pyruvate kinase [Gammaproteobacteria bacterium]
MSIVTSFDLLKHRRSKIVATLGPRTRDADSIRALVAAGVDVFRLNMSHGNHAEHAAVIAHIRTHAAALERHTAILVDLCGPKIRTGRFVRSPLTLTAGREVTVTMREVVGDETLIPSQYAGLAGDVRAGDRVLLNDGAVELRVLGVEGSEVRCAVVSGGPIGDHKGINLPGVEVSAPSLTEKDIQDAHFALAQEVDFIALSFVRRPEDVAQLRAILARHPVRPAIVAKIEKPEALENSLEIIDAADAIMVARGDLGVELQPEQVPLAQHQLIRLARRRDRPVIVATQMLESMITNARPTRAEVTDVSDAVASGADAVMLSGETAIGEFPIEAVAMMSRVARQTEAYQYHMRPAGGRAHATGDPGHVSFGDAIANAVAQLVADTAASAVVVLSMQGMTATTISAARPDAPIVAVSREAAVCRRMNLLWGTLPVADPGAGTDNPNAIARRVVLKLGLAEPGQYIVLVRGFHAAPELNTPTVTLMTV